MPGLGFRSAGWAVCAAVAMSWASQQTTAQSASSTVVRTQQAFPTGECGQAETSVALEVRGIPDILLEVVDQLDPVEVGGTTTYVIEVTNQGSADGTNIAITCTLPPELQYVSANGPSPLTAQGRTVRFTPLAVLAPRAKTAYQVVVMRLAVGDVRFKVSMNSDQIDQVVEETESTHVY